MVAFRVRRGKSGFLGILAICVAATSSPEGRSENHKFQSAPAPPIDISRTSNTDAKRAITLDDMVSLREVHEPRQSPDGQHIAFLVKQAFRQCDCYRTALYLAQSHGQTPAQKLTEEDYIANLQWLPDGQSISYLSSKDGSVQLWRLDLKTNKAEPVFVHTPNHDRTTAHVAFQSSYLPASGLQDYRWSPDGQQIAFTAEPPLDPSITSAAAKEGFRYDDTTMLSWDLIVGDWGSVHRSAQLWFYDVRKKQEHVVWTTPSTWYARLTALRWSPSGRELAFVYSVNGGADPDVVGVVDTATSAISQIGAAEGTVSAAGMAWSPDEHAIAYIARYPVAPSSTLAILDIINHSRKVLSHEIYPGHIDWLAWDADGHRILFVSEGIGMERRQTGLYSLSESGGAPIRLTATTERVNDCDVILQKTLACVWQTPSIPPRPALVSIAEGSIQGLDDVNPELKSVELGSVRELEWENQYGNKTNGFLVMPIRRVPGTRMPLVVIGYGFSGEFVAQANSVLATYPAQAFARDGVAVLLFNYPRYEDWEGPNFERGSRAIGYGPLSSIQAIVKQLDSDGLIDPHRVGIMGHSMAGFWVQLAITQTNLFKAVEMHNGGTASEPGTYWELGSKWHRDVEEHIMGGPPFGDTLQNYLNYSITLNAHRIRAPVLMEYDAMEALSAMEYYEAMQHYGVPVDFFIYPNDGHVTERPEHRFMSMQRNLDWFEFWLLGKENDASTKAEQYARWRQFKAISEGNAHVDPPERRRE